MKLLCSDDKDKKAGAPKLLAFLLVTLFMVSLSVLLLELTLTRIFSIVLWYDYAFMAISIAFSGLGIGALLVYILKNQLKKREQELPSKIFQSTIAFAISVPIFLFVIGHMIPPNTSFLYLFYLVSSIPFFFAGISMAQIYLMMSREISKLYFADLAGAAAGTLILDPLLQQLGAESVLLLTSLLVIGPSLFVLSLSLFISSNKKRKKIVPSSLPIIENKVKLYGIIILAAFSVLLAANVASPNLLAIQPGVNKGLYVELANSSAFKHLSTQWNSFSRIDVTRNIYSPKVLAEIRIDADAVTPVFRWNGSSADIQWLKGYMDYIPYEISASSNKNNNSSTLVIGGGGGEDILVALASGSKNVTAVELNPLIVSAAKRFGGSLAGNLYQRADVKLFIDDGRRFISSTNTKYDKIVIKLVDSWAAQLAGGYALSENYLYTVEAFKQYLHHLNGNNGMLVMVRWNFELPRLMPLVVESLLEEKSGEARSKSIQDISKQILVIEDRPGLYFGSLYHSTVYPVLVIVKNGPFSSSELDLVKAKIAKDGARVIAMPGTYVQPPYDNLLSVSANQSNTGFVPLYWNDPLGNCRIYFRCTANFTNGWKDNTSFELSTTSSKSKTSSWIYGREIDVKPNEHYQLVTHMKLNEFATQSHIKIEGYNETSNKWYQITQCPSGVNGPLEWHEYSCKLTIPKDTTKVRPILNAGWSSQPDKEAVTWIDDINLSNLDNVYSKNKTYPTTTTTTISNLISNPDLVYYSDSKKSQQSDDPSTTTTTILNLKPPTDDSPFYFAREQIPHQMIILLETVLGISAVLALLLIYYSRLNRVQLTKLSPSSRLYLLFAGLIGLGFIFLEITFIQKFLLLLGTPIMALAVILFSILLSTGIGAFLSGKLFSKDPFKAVVVSIPILVGILIAYYYLLPGIIYSDIVLPLQLRIELTFALLSPAGFLMGFQFPSITRMAALSSSNSSAGRRSSSVDDVSVTLLWGINVITSVIGTVLTAISSMVIGFNSNLLIGLALYLAALTCAMAAVRIKRHVSTGKEAIVK